MSYRRYYAGEVVAGRKMIIGVYTNFPMKPPAKRKAAGLPSGAHIVAFNQLPMVMDGGCGVVTVYFDVPSSKQSGGSCNGYA